MSFSRTRLHDLSLLLLKVKNSKKMADVLADLLTPQELISISERLHIVKALVQGIPQRTIAHTLHVSIGKITRGSRVVKYGKTDWEKLFTHL